MSIKYIVTGLDASGKTLLSTELVAAHSAVLAHIEDDQHRYVPDSNWVKKPKTEFLEGVRLAVDAHTANGKASVLDCAYNDVYDPERAMAFLLRDAVTSAPAGSKPVVVVLTMGTRHKAVETLLARIVKRKQGLESGFCEETMASSAGLLIKFIDHYAVNAAALDDFSKFALDAGCAVLRGSYEEVRAVLLGPRAPYSCSATSAP